MSHAAAQTMSRGSTHRLSRRHRCRNHEEEQKMMQQPTADQALRALEPLVGEWTVEARGPDGRSWPGEARASFAWHSSGAHLVQRIVTDVPDAPDSTSIIGCDAGNATYVQLYSDERGVCRVYAMNIGGGEWTLQRQGVPFAQRFVGAISEDGHEIAGRWEKAEDGDDFTVDFSLTYRKVTSF
jgi:hypothetical protein